MGNTRVVISDEQKRRILHDDEAVRAVEAAANAIAGKSASLFGRNDFQVVGAPGRVRYHARVATTTKRAAYRGLESMLAAAQSVLPGATFKRGQGRKR